MRYEPYEWTLLRLGRWQVRFMVSQPLRLIHLLVYAPWSGSHTAFHVDVGL